MKRIDYGEHEDQFGVLRLPEGEGPHPVIIVIHGGYWRLPRGLEIVEPLAMDLTKRGFATWNIEYRRVGQDGGGWPGTFLDTAQAADHLKTLAQAHALNLDQVYAIGHSAGGHLAFWLAARHRLPADSPLDTGDTPLAIHKVVSLAGVLDLERMQDICAIRSRYQEVSDQDESVADLIGGTPQSVPERYQQASPLAMLPFGAKQIVVHGLLDIHVPYGIGIHYKQAAEKAGEDVQFIELPNEEHMQLVDPTADAWAVIIEALLK